MLSVKNFIVKFTLESVADIALKGVCHLSGVINLSLIKADGQLIIPRFRFHLRHVSSAVRLKLILGDTQYHIFSNSLTSEMHKKTILRCFDWVPISETFVV